MIQEILTEVKIGPYPHAAAIAISKSKILNKFYYQDSKLSCPSKLTTSLSDVLVL
jgi:hypothetical protein